MDSVGWKDSIGMDCEDYESHEICDDGTIGPGWEKFLTLAKVPWGTLVLLVNTDGVDASQACCAAPASSTQPASRARRPCRLWVSSRDSPGDLASRWALPSLPRRVVSI